MKKKVFLSIFFSSLLTLVLTASFMVSVIYNNSLAELKSEVRAQAAYISAALDALGDGGMEYLQSLEDAGKNRITLIGSDGVVEYDSFVDAGGLENHAGREEFAEAISEGSGEAMRSSDTVDKQTYYYAVRLSGGDVLRIANVNKSVLGILSNAIASVIYISLLVLITATVFAFVLTSSIIRPINTLNLDDPESNHTYDELEPLLKKLSHKNAEIAYQIRKITAQTAEFEYITSNMSEGLVVLSSSGEVLFANAGAKKLLSCEAGVKYRELRSGEALHRAAADALSGTPAKVRAEYDGRVYDVTASPADGGRDEFSAVLFMVDVTDTEQAERLRREFSANVSHELKTPITSIMGYAELISCGLAQAEDVMPFAGHIRSEAARLLSLIEDIIKLSRLDEEDLKSSFEPVELSALCREAIAQLEKNGEKSGVTLSFHGDEAVIRGFSPVLYEMIFNLCDNGVKYNRPGGHVSVSVEKSESEVTLTVADTGRGIPEACLSRVFERFYRVDKSHSKQTGGTGLGLSIVKHGAALHGARLELKSTLGEGTEVGVTFPLGGMS